MNEKKRMTVDHWDKHAPRFAGEPPGDWAPSHNFGAKAGPAMKTRPSDLAEAQKRALRSALETLERRARDTVPQGAGSEKGMVPEGGHVLIVNPEGLAERGGMGRMVRYLVEAVSVRTDGPRFDVLDSRGRHAAWLSPFYLARAIYQILRAKRAGTVRLVHVNMAEKLSVARKGVVVLVCRALRIPTLLHLHAGLFIPFYERQGALARAWLKLIFCSATKTAVLGELWKRYLVAELGLPADKIAVVSNGVVRAPPRRRLSPGAPCRIVYVGKLRKEKGLTELIDCLSEADLAALPWSLTLVGEGARASFEAQARARGIASRLHFEGWLDQQALGEKLADADIFVLPSHYEGMPLAILEALSAGLAVIATKVGAVPEILTDGETGLLVPPEDPPALHHALMRLILDHHLRERLGRAGEDLYTSHFTVEHFCASVLNLYDEIAPLKPATPIASPEMPHDPDEDRHPSTSARQAKAHRRAKS